MKEKHLLIVNIRLHAFATVVRGGQEDCTGGPFSTFLLGAGISRGLTGLDCATDVVEAYRWLASSVVPPQMQQYT